MVEYKHRCQNCGMIVTTDRVVDPEPKMGGPCRGNGNHSWIGA